ncbi:MULTISPECIES: response regulator transcription factor [unclassified Bradyrhizobium]|uniref:response regulator transcription factor n=1 Tax=unclassified Bradyrhizobium TaxID=2631580 RepID=UPI002447CA13|nr:MULTISPECIES: response regulator transcription factor [unclassified Bradyrhizobium]MDH2345506.1 response regulator transcription factor [Bradyrhizobium sp. SSUT77]MDH2356908.1 response regulator transcription factor [Bradyrhizobium sp. SSUT112]
MRILVVDRDTDFARAVKEALLVCGFAVDVVRILDEAETALACASYHIVLLELVLPDGDGLDWLKQLRREGCSIPAIIVSKLNDLGRRIAIFNGGADDFLPKPVSIDELVARMRAILRRSPQMTAPVLTFGNLHFDSIGRQVSIDDRQLRIARRELCILEHLLSRAGRTVPRASLEEGLYAFDDEVSTNALEVGIYRLRTHLSRSGATLRITTVRGVGYALELAQVPAAQSIEPESEGSLEVRS